MSDTTIVEVYYNLCDDSIRLTLSGKPDEQLLKKLRELNFRWWPGRKINVAKWSTHAEDFVLKMGELEGMEIYEEEDDPEARSNRFEKYSDHAQERADRLRENVDAITQNIPLGQPILIGHHSERHARKDAKRIENGMRKTIEELNKADYWTGRAKAAIRHAKFKADPGVIYRRIERLEADYRKCQRSQGVTQNDLGWMAHSIIRDEMSKPYGTDFKDLAEDEKEKVKARMREMIEDRKEHYQRRIDHLDMVLQYQRGLYAAAGGVTATKSEIFIGDFALWGDKWMEIVDVNPKTIVVKYGQGRRRLERSRISEIKPGERKTKKKKNLLPIVNDPEGVLLSVPSSDWNKKPDDYKGLRKVDGKYRVRIMMTTGFQSGEVYLTDKKIVTKASILAGAVEEEEDDAPLPTAPVRQRPEYKESANKKLARELKEKADAVAAAPVIQVPGLFPTPRELALRMIEMADIQDGMTVLEPEAGTGNILREILAVTDPDNVSYCEINRQASEILAGQFRAECVGMDFLELNHGSKFDRIIMNPPFEDGQDIDHVRHAYDLLNDDGRMVAIMSPGPFFRSDRKSKEFREWFKDQVAVKTDLPPDSFKMSGTNVSTVMVVIDKKGE